MSLWFKNLIVYRLPGDWSLSAAQLEEHLSRRRLRECGALEMFNRGFVAPGGDESRLVVTVNQQHLIALGTNQKLLPASIIRQVAQERARELEQEQGHPVGRRQLREIKDRVTTELRARALTRRKVLRAWIDTVNGWLIVDSSSLPRAEELVETLRDTLGTLAVTLLDTERAPHTSMAAWLNAGDAPGRLSIDQDLELCALDKTKATVRSVRHPLEAREIKAHLANGKLVTRLGLTWNDRIAFVLTDKLQLKRVEFLEMAEQESDQAAEDIGADEKFTAEFVLMTGELSQLITDVVSALGGADREREAA